MTNLLPNLQFTIYFLGGHGHLFYNCLILYKADTGDVIMCNYTPHRLDTTHLLPDL